MTELLVHEQQREPELAAGVVDTGRATAGVSEFGAVVKIGKSATSGMIHGAQHAGSVPDAEFSTSQSELIQ